jgi:CubicO group peptidase (beta-lactamase class C family)
MRLPDNGKDAIWPGGRCRAGAPPADLRWCLPVVIALSLANAPVVFAEIRPNDCVRAAKYSESKRGTAVLVIQNGHTVFEHYANGGSAVLRWPIFSGTKNFWGIAALCAVRDDLFKLDDPVANTISEWKTDPRKFRITFRQLLNFTDGIEGASYLHRASIPNRDAVAVRLPLLAEPGRRFIYGPSHLQIFVEVLRRKLNGRSPIGYIQQNVLQPLGLGSMEFKADSHGNPLAASGFELTAREWARLGQLVLGQGKYQGRSIVSPNLMRQAFTGSAANPSYGLTFWLNAQAPGAAEIDTEKELDLPWERARWDNVCIARTAPADMVTAIGSEYQRLFVIPSLDAIIVRQGRGGKFSDAQFLRLVLGRR